MVRSALRGTSVWSAASNLRPKAQITNVVPRRVGRADCPLPVHQAAPGVRSLPLPARDNALQAGFTLLELLVTLAIAAILLSVAIPGFGQLVASTRASTQANALLSGLQHARSLAVTRPATVTICPSRNGIDCQGNAWNRGWIVKAEDVTHDPRIMQVGEDMGHATSLLNPSTAPTRIEFTPSGATTGARLFIGLAVGQGQSVQHRCITVSPAGESRVQATAQHTSCAR